MLWPQPKVALRAASVMLYVLVTDGDVLIKAAGVNVPAEVLRAGPPSMLHSKRLAAALAVVLVKVSSKGVQPIVSGEMLNVVVILG